MKRYNIDTETVDDASFPAQKIVDFYKEIGKLPKTSGSTPEDFITKFDEIHEKYPDAQILYLAYLMKLKMLKNSSLF